MHFRLQFYYTYYYETKANQIHQKRMKGITTLFNIRDKLSINYTCATLNKNTMIGTDANVIHSLLHKHMNSRKNEYLTNVRFQKWSLSCMIKIVLFLNRTPVIKRPLPLPPPRHPPPPPLHTHFRRVPSPCDSPRSSVCPLLSFFFRAELTVGRDDRIGSSLLDVTIGSGADTGFLPGVGAQ